MHNRTSVSIRIDKGTLDRLDLLKPSSSTITGYINTLLSEVAQSERQTNPPK